jgi:PAS domain S-box-containing protein
MQIEQETDLGAYARLMLEHQPVATALFDAHEFRLLAANPSYQSSFLPQFQHEQAIGHHLMEVVPATVATKLSALFLQVIETGTAAGPKEYASSACDGSTRYWHWSVNPISERGAVTAVLLTAIEVTTLVIERKQAFQAQEAILALTEEQHRLHTVLDQLPEGIVLVEARTGKVRYANSAAADMLGFTLPHLIGTPLNQSALRSPYGLSGQHQQSVFRWNFALIHALWGKKVTNQEIIITRPDGSEIVVLSSAAPIRMPNGLIREAVLVFQDITSLKQLEHQKNEFFAVTNHELRTPLTSILGFTELLLGYPTQGTEEMYEYAIGSIAQECEYLARLLDDLLEVSRLEYGRLDLKRRYQDLLVPLTQIVNKRIQINNRHHLHFKLEELAPEEQLMGWFDLLRIEQIVRNLLSNAVKYSATGSAIEIGARPHRDALGRAQEVVLWVKDEGIGIATRDLPHIFERFYRAGSLETSSVSGFGIGLYLTKQLVKEHEGRIWVESRVGQGSTFFVALPLKEVLSGTNTALTGQQA